MPSMLRLPSGLFRSRFPTKAPHAFLSSHACHMPCPAQPPLFDQPNIIWRVIMKLHPPVSSPLDLHFLLRILLLRKTHQSTPPPPNVYHMHVKQHAELEFIYFNLSF